MCSVQGGCSNVPVLQLRVKLEADLLAFWACRQLKEMHLREMPLSEEFGPSDSLHGPIFVLCCRLSLDCDLRFDAATCSVALYRLEQFARSLTGSRWCSLLPSAMPLGLCRWPLAAHKDMQILAHFCSHMHAHALDGIHTLT